MEPHWAVSVSPHIRMGKTTAGIMWTVLASLIPAMLLSVYVFGLRGLLVTLVSVISCMAVEAISQKALGRPVSVSDGSAALTGVLMAFVIPPGVPYWMPIIGAVAAIFINKELMGGIGFNIWNPALVGRAILTAAFPVYMTTAWIAPIDWSKSGLGAYVSGLDAVSTATPLQVLKQYGFSALTQQFGDLTTIYQNFFLGIRPGCIGETSALLILLGGLFLMIRGIITWHIPVSTIATVAILSWTFGGETWFSGQPLVHVLSGGLMLGAFYMATDYVTSPAVKSAQIVFGIGVGALTVLIRLKGGYPEGVAYSILLMNCLTPSLDEWFKPQRFAPPKQAPVAAVK
ncbi:RnfABCDGE type electron transport complex subunit D [Desulfomonile tiedjei]|uniref:Ion-translocating oxidoreductase complex subunit D n=1 Tax=Desulfomonile tiedjei (strain ATCC 49306 / DSM 6799 / DCB-1) TaxID=706587 RepID=I4C7N1_DESTA|nr:RnfABCDGE type electron transport complex subunit D [Desulfomonile tiedjei]AFM25572.1 electron transport complex, RnfABCDGE type, D subunit [Desulfomonile tiedjei DSM 6799]